MTTHTAYHTRTTHHTPHTAHRTPHTTHHTPHIAHRPLPTNVTFQEAETLLATQPLRVAMEQGDGVELGAAITQAKQEVKADKAVIEVSEDTSW